MAPFSVTSTLRIADEIRHVMAEAGFSALLFSERPLQPAPATCVLGIRRDH